MASSKKSGVWRKLSVPDEESASALGDIGVCGRVRGAVRVR